jgi:hypothetical protein
MDHDFLLLHPYRYIRAFLPHINTRRHITSAVDIIWQNNGIIYNCDFVSDFQHLSLGIHAVNCSDLEFPFFLHAHAVKVHSTVISPIFCMDVSLSEERRLSLFQNKFLRSVLRAKTVELTRGWTKLHNNELQSL